ncbi:MAG: YvcK family protein [Candidatus Caldarchaeum sp.]
MSTAPGLLRIILSAKGLRHALSVLLLGLIIFLLGIALSYERILLPLISWIDALTRSLLERTLPQEDLPLARHYVAGALLMLGIFLLFRGGYLGLRTILHTLNPGYEGKIVGTLLKRQLLSTGPYIVAIGGGTGLSTLLRGIKHKTSRISAIVTVTDEGGSSGRLREDKQMLPPGDIRNCLVALSDAEKIMTDLFQHRFEGASGSLSGHSTGNLLIAAMVDITGDFDKAIQQISQVLAIRGRVLPSTLSSVRLKAEMEDGSILCGETNIVNSRLRIRRIWLEPPDAQPLPEAIQAIQEADIIAIGPGSIYTSVIPPLMVNGMGEAIQKSSAVKVYICNVMTQPGESDGFCASDHVSAIESNVQRRVFDYVLVNKALPTEALLKKYSEFGQEFVEPDIDRIRSMGYKPITANLISESDVVRHDPIRLADSLLKIANL